MGLQVHTAEWRQLPIVYLRLVIGSGGETDPANLPGMAHLVGAMLKEGTRTRSSAEIAEQVGFLGRGAVGVGRRGDGRHRHARAFRALRRSDGPARRRGNPPRISTGRARQAQASGDRSTGPADEPVRASSACANCTAASTATIPTRASTRPSRRWRGCGAGTSSRGTASMWCRTTPCSWPLAM